MILLYGTFSAGTFRKALTNLRWLKTFNCPCQQVVTNISMFQSFDGAESCVALDVAPRAVVKNSVAVVLPPVTGKASAVGAFCLEDCYGKCCCCV